MHANMHDDGFLEELVALVQTHDCSREKLLTLFGKYSQAVEIQDMQDADFDYAILAKTARTILIIIVVMRKAVISFIIVLHRKTMQI